ncbi:hypothetical protein ACHAXT_012779 [Thalassiosira profunda]
MTLTETTKAAETVRVVAPATLREGYTFDVVVEGETQRVEVPSGGVSAGEEFDAIVATTTPPAFNPEVVAVPIPEGVPASQLASAANSHPPASIATNKTIVHNPDGTATITEEITYPDGHATSTTIIIPAGVPPEAAVSHAASSPPIATTASAPTGAWRHGIFSCFETCDSGLFWMGWCCTYIAMGQLLQRLKLDACGHPGPNYKQSCITWTILCAASCVLWWFVIVTEGWGAILFLALIVAVTEALTRARYHMRRKWEISPECCEESGCLSDCCCVFWCPCCSVIQAMRHTHDGRVHRYNCCSPTGLDEGAPEVA